MTTDDRLRALEERFDSFIAAQSEVTAELRAMIKIHDQRSKDHEQWMRGSWRDDDRAQADAGRAQGVDHGNASRESENMRILMKISQNLGLLDDDTPP